MKNQSSNKQRQIASCSLSQFYFVIRTISSNITIVLKNALAISQRFFMSICFCEIVCVRKNIVDRDFQRQASCTFVIGKERESERQRWRKREQEYPIIMTTFSKYFKRVFKMYFFSFSRNFRPEGHDAGGELAGPGVGHVAQPHRVQVSII